MSDSALDPNVQPTSLATPSSVPRLNRRVIGLLLLVAAAVLAVLIYSVLDRAAPRPATDAALPETTIAPEAAQPPPDLGNLVPGYQPDLVEIPPAPPPEPALVPAPAVPVGPPPEPPAVAERRQRIEQHREDLFRDALVAPTTVSAPTAAAAPGTPAAAPGTAFPAVPPRPPSAAAVADATPADPNLRDRKDSFAATDRADGRAPLYAIPPSPTAHSELRAGTVLPAVLLTGINTDLPGQLVAQVSRDVRDSLTGDHVLVPAGARLLGTYDSHVAYGQRRALVSWSSLQLPDGSSVPIGNMPGADPAGLSGLHDRVDNHYWRTFSGATLLSVISAGAQLSQPDRRTTAADGRPLTAEEQLAADLGRQWSEVSEQFVTRGLDVQPSLTIRPGYRFRVVVTRDIVLAPWPSA